MRWTPPFGQPSARGRQLVARPFSRNLEFMLVGTTPGIMPVHEFSTPVAFTAQKFFSNSVFLAEDVFLSIFFPTQPAPFKTGVIPAVLPVKGLR